MRLAHLNKKHSQATKDLISQKMKEHWAQIPDDPFADCNVKK